MLLHCLAKTQIQESRIFSVFHSNVVLLLCQSSTSRCFVSSILFTCNSYSFALFGSYLRWFLGRIACIAQVRPIATDDARSVVCVTVCVCVFVCVCHTDVLRKNGWTDRDAVCGADSCGSKEPCIRRGSRLKIPDGKGQCWDLFGYWKALGVSAMVYAAQGVIQWSITIWQRDCCWSMSHYIAPWKIHPLPCGLSSEFVEQADSGWGSDVQSV